MKISSTPNTKHNTVADANNSNNATPKRVQSFGSAGDTFKSALAKPFKFTDRGGFLVEFLIIDAISMIAPRVWVGLNRDKEKIGHLNYQAGAEEAGREMLSGPSMQLVPMAIAATAIHNFMPSVKMSTEMLGAFNYNLKELVDENSSLKDKAEINKKFAERIFDKSFESFNVNKKAEYKKEFVALLEKATTTKPRLALIKKFSKSQTEHEKAEKSFIELITKMNNENKTETAPKNKYNVPVKNGSKEPHNINAKDLFEDFHNYSKDVIEKFTKKDASKSVEDFFKGIEKSRSTSKIVLALAAFFAVGGVLLYLPKLYQRSDVSPAEQSAKRAQAEAGGANEN